MNKKMILSLILFSALFTQGCWVYGQGETTGYIYAVDDGIFWDKVWYKSSLDSSESDCYLLNDNNLKQQLRSISGDSKVKLTYDRHLATIGVCDDATDDEIISIQII